MPQFQITVDEKTAEDIRRTEAVPENIWIGSWNHDNPPIQEIREVAS